MRKNHKFFSSLAFNLAENHLGQTSTNPSVGCVVVKNQAVISAGLTSINGRPHAEYNALNKKINFKGSDLYVTLEPCSHYGYTPPCTNIIKKKKIRKVFYVFDDPDYRTKGQARKEFTKHRIYFKKLKNIKKNFYNYYFINKQRNLPLIDAKIAISKDYYTINKKQKSITNTRSKIVTHLLRSRYDSIISTAKTINNDNALLNCRINGLNNNKPDLLIIDRKLKLKKNLKLFKLLNKRKTYIFTASKNIKKIDFFRKKNCKVIMIDRLENENDFNILLNLIFKLGKRRILVETGLIFLIKLLKLNIINDLFIFQTNKKLKQNGRNNISSNFIKKYRLYKKEVKVNLKEDKLYKIKV